MEVLAIDIYPGDTLSDFVAFWRRNTDKDVLWAHEDDQGLVRDYRILTLGQTVVIDRQGRMVYNGFPLEYDSLKKLVEEEI